MHRLEDKTLITPALVRRLNAEGQFDGASGNVAAFVQRCNGDLLTYSLACSAGPMEVMFASDLLTGLNKHLHHDGAWLIAFTHYEPPSPPQAHGTFHRFVILWMDRDGDVQFPIEFHEGLDAAMLKGFDSWMNDCETAWTLWHHAMRCVLDPQPDETFHRAQGERAPTVH